MNGAHRLASLFEQLRSRSRLIGQAGWLAGSYALGQVIRLGTSIVLAWLLAPQLLGTMLIINTLRTGGELLSDVGVGQSIVNNPRGADPRFYNTAWTIQIIRGFVLTLIGLVAAGPLATIYGDPALVDVIRLSSLIFIISGFTSPARFLLQKNLKVREVAIYELGVSLVTAIVHVVLAWYMPTIWALVIALLAGTTINTVASFFLMRDCPHALVLDRADALSILHFGKWIFLATLVYFLSMNYDRLYLASMIPVAVLGIYGIARSYADTGLMLVQRFGNQLIFPKIAAASQRGSALRQVIAPVRGPALGVIALGLAVAVVGADVAVQKLYDSRYHDAAVFLPFLLAGIWFAILCSLADAVMLGVGKPAPTAQSNAIKLAWIAGALPLALAHYGIVGALGVIVTCDLVRYAVMLVQSRRAEVAFTRQDLTYTLLFFALILVLREGSHWAGLTGGIDGWLDQLAALTA